MLTYYDSSREHDEAIAEQMAESLRSFSTDLYADVKCRLENNYVNLSESNGGFDLVFSVNDGMRLGISGSDTQNGDCFSAVLMLGGRCVLFIFSDKSPVSEFKERLSGLVCALAGNRVSVCERIRAHKSREIVFSTLDYEGKRTEVFSQMTLKGLAASLLLWKSSETETVFDLRYNTNLY